MVASFEAGPAGARARSLSIVAERGQGLGPCTTCDARSFSVCSAIEDRHLARLAEVAHVMHIDPGRTFIHEGDAADYFFNITDGNARIYKLLADGRRQIIGFASAGHFLGLAVSATYAFGAEAIDKVRLCRFSRWQLRQLLDDFPAMEQRLLEVAANELVVAQEQMLLLGRKTARERVASFLMTRTVDPLSSGQLRLALPMSRNDIADYLGLTIETVSRTLSLFRHQRLIEVKGHSEVVVLDLAKLRGTAGSI